MNNIFIIIIAIFLLAFTLLIKKVLNESIMNPAILFSLYWSVQVLIGSFVFYDTDLFVGAMYIEIIALTTLLAGGITKYFVEYRSRTTIIKKYTFNLKSVESNVWFYMSILIGGMYPLRMISSYGISITNLISQLTALNTTAAVDRYTGDAFGGGVNSFLLTFVYFSTILGGVKASFSSRRKDLWISLLGFLPAFLILFTQNTKSVFLGALFLYVSSFLSTAKLRKLKLNIKPKNIFQVFLGILLTFAFMIISMMLRIGTFSFYTLNIVIEKFYIYALGHIVAFSNWLENYHGSFISTNNMTFIGLFDLIGISNREQGVYNNFIVVKNSTTNIFTVFRGLITDYGSVGTIVFIFIFTSITCYCYYKAAFSRHTIICQFFLLSYYFFTFYSFIVSIWSYNSFNLCFILFIIFLFTSLSKRWKND